MAFEEFRSKCIEIFAKNDFLPTPSDEQIDKLYKLTEIMLEVNKSMNLTAITEESAVILKHYADSVSISRDIPEGARLIDVGCGAGFPSLPLAIFRPDISITALDSTAKRIDYVRATAEKLGLDNLTAVAARAEEHSRRLELRESFDIATARAVAAMPVLCEICLPFVKVGGKFIAMKASQGLSEAEVSKKAATVCGGSITEVKELSLVSISAEPEKRVVITVEKLSRTPDKYPRHYSQISKKPL
jgi:16S rRNA (guanine527-N7)-methyltransferase